MELLVYEVLVWNCGTDWGRAGWTRLQWWAY